MIKRGIEIIGFDLDGTLYKSTKDIDNRVRTQIAYKLLEKKPDLHDIRKAREFFEQRYAALQGGSKVLAEAGYEDASKVMDECLGRANIIDLLKKDHSLIQMMSNLVKRYDLFLLTSSPTRLASSKLKALGIEKDIFRWKAYSDTPGIGSKSDGTAFRNILTKINYPEETIIYVGDRLKSDILPAKQLGIQTVAVWSNIPEANASIAKITDLEGLLK